MMYVSLCSPKHFVQYLCNTVVLVVNVVNVLLQFDVFSYVLHIVDMKVIDGPNIGHIRSAQRSTKFTLF